MNVTDATAHPVVLLTLLTKTYGPAWMEWAPAVLRQTLEKDSGSVPARAVMNKALAAAALATRDEFWEAHEMFHFIVQALKGLTPVLDEMQEHTLADMMIAAWTAQHIREELGEFSHIPTYSEDVTRYVAGQAKNCGVWFLEGTPLAFAHDAVAGKWYHCKTCNRDAEVVFHDGLCDFCIDRWNPEHLGGWTPDPILLKKGLGKNIVLYERNPSAPVRARLAALEKTPGLQLVETQVDACATRLLAAKASLAASTQKMRDSLHTLSAGAA